MMTNLPCSYLTKTNTLQEFKQGHVETHLLIHVYSALLLILGICAHISLKLKNKAKNNP